MHCNKPNEKKIILSGHPKKVAQFLINFDTLSLMVKLPSLLNFLKIFDPCLIYHDVIYERPLNFPKLVSTYHRDPDVCEADQDQWDKVLNEAEGKHVPEK
jgi:hypothetical protein